LLHRYVVSRPDEAPRQDHRPSALPAGFYTAETLGNLVRYTYEGVELWLARQLESRGVEAYSAAAAWPWRAASRRRGVSLMGQWSCR
jgi:hypothetical protein